MKRNVLGAATVYFAIVFAVGFAFEHLALYGEASHLLGLAGQIVFALLPIARIRWP